MMALRMHVMVHAGTDGEGGSLHEFAVSRTGFVPPGLRRTVRFPPAIGEFAAGITGGAGTQFCDDALSIAWWGPVLASSNRQDSCCPARET
jgi:hypothetical protein